MTVYSIWESRFPAETTEEGIRVTQAIWRDMLSFDGYLAHELIVAVNVVPAPDVRR